MVRKLAATGLIALSLAIPGLSAGAQSAVAWVARGDSAYDARNATAALEAYQKALAIDPNNYDASWRAARSQVDLALGESDAGKRSAMYKAAQDEAAHAIQVNPSGADGHFVSAEALGRMALTLGARDRVKYAGKVRDQALECLRIEPKHAGCLHVMGVWNAEVMRLNGFTRLIARNFLGGQVFSQASWANARSYLEQAVTNDPRRIVHRLDLAKVYVDMGLPSLAKTEYQAVLSGELVDYNDPKYKAEAAEALKKLQ
ncbi:MAG TPA: tetratricopeptide repeat protein [Gemmatimonadaceae bacterium]|nr:tetratricopeptide repeat protein [Gemmatimonadaceae bacterium]